LDRDDEQEEDRQGEEIESHDNLVNVGIRKLYEFREVRDEAVERRSIPEDRVFAEETGGRERPPHANAILQRAHVGQELAV
jgi:hypothetical protein